MSQSDEGNDAHDIPTRNWESELAESVPEEAEQQQTFFAPPAHIAARFYRNALTRRKSSAASSRRNSLSSAQSHTSSRSHRRGSTGCQSTYIAQHLRRASIIESRKARLADRAAHAEQVRLRAALAKATPRGNNQSEERAVAAQLAKEKYLAKVAAACAEEVARAKRIAEEVKDRKLAEETRLRLEMEERHAEAEKRRAEYQRNLQIRRARRAMSAEKKLAVLEEVDVLDEEAIIDEIVEVEGQVDEVAAKRIQRAWHLYQRRKPVVAFKQLYLSAHRAQNTVFEEMTALVADTQVIDATTAMLTHLGLQEPNDANASLNTRTFLSAYMICAHPVAVLLNKTGAQEQDLISKASDLISQFEASVERLAPWNDYTANPMQLETLSQSYTAYTSAFAAWRLQDSSVLVDGMVASFVELDAIWQTVKDDSRGEVASDYRQGIRDNQVMLLSRIRKLAGPDRADMLIKKAIRESRRKRPKQRPASEVRPRGVEAASSDSGPSEQVVDEALPTFAVGSGEINKLFTSMPSNRVLTHELAIDKHYKLEDRNGDLRHQLYRSICDSMKAGFEAGNGAVWTVSAAENVKEKLLRMLKPGNNMYTMISEALDLDNINQQCQRGVFSYSGFFNFMANVLPKLCAPFRDQEVKALTDYLKSDENGDELNTMIEKLFRLLRMVDVLSLDYTNFMIMNVAPQLIKEAPGYEQRMFAKDLESHVVTLIRTRRWWQESYTSLTAEADRRDPEGVRHPSDRPSPQKIYTHALVETAISQGELDKDAVPETLLLDLERLQHIRTKAIRVAVVGAILLTTKNMLKRDVRSQWKTEAGRLWQLLSTEPYSTSSLSEPFTAAKAFSVLETAHNMPPSTKSHIYSTISRFFSQAAAATSSGEKFTDPVLKVLFQRLKSHVLSRLSAETSADRVRAASSASEKLAACGMAEFTSQVAGIVEVLERVRVVDWEGHGGWYGKIVEEM
ncbi:T-complex protein 11-like protein 2 [Fulvia fulva]|uniref:T-complex protein 11-like protein 2 n=1 Tax=Passalora fulva TaxID=5499 RepID=A0A9Q8UVU5_PASFU|nr:T-complex protein 11-like protein 2 [Fulvia fulva]KAK4610442.1 T-complex protein 11-like protein 2 [Fulvia fulva]KAK4611003.1 T-complex protein 11-like protein 2 [Fulvia fulva]UJO24295.1 T-complex protein 11-like protein 2 [Fulvia fulva]WPV22122.1 T-complex protein 11-like protein 2 [Fulvia fulva]WPV36865.1 T-complex protein 11-like protein 2 [Fulvia fulva]